MAPTPEPDPLVTLLLNETKAGLDEHQNRVTRYDRAYDVYRGSPKIPKSLEAWQSRLRVRYGMQVLDTAMVNMVTGKPRCKVLARSPDHAENSAAFQHVMDYYTDKSHLVEAVPVTVQQGLIYGVTVGKNHWLYREGNRLVKQYEPHPATGQQMPRVSEEKVVYYDGPMFEPWDVYDAWWEPNARSVDDAAWIILRSWLTKRDILEQACTVSGDHSPLDCDGLYHNVEELFQTGTDNAQQASAQDRYLGGNTNLRKDRFELWEIWRDNRLTVLGNRQVIMRDCPNPHWHGKKPIVVASTRPDLFKMQGIPETELVDDLQQALWTIENMRMDNLHLTVMRGFTYREGGVTDPNALVLKPRFLWAVTDHDDVRPVEIQPLPPEAYQEESELLQRMQYVTGISPYIAGAGTDQIDQNTATGISLLTNAASALLRFKAQQIHNRCWQRTFEQWGDDIQQFMDQPLWVKIVGDGGAQSWRQVGPQDVVGDFDYVLQDSEESLSRQQERQDAMALLQGFAPLAQTGIINFKPLLEKIARAFGFENPAELFNPPAQIPPAAPHQNGGGSLPAPQQGQQLVGAAQMPYGVQQAVMAGR